MFRSSILAAVGLAVLGVAAPATAQVAVPADRIALNPDADATFARRLLMNAIGTHDDVVHDMLAGELPMDQAEIRHRLLSMAAMLYAMPSLYRAEPDPHSAAAELADPARTSLSTIAVWEDFEAFRALSTAAYLKADEAYRAHPSVMQARVDELEALCEGCHARFRKPFEDLDFDNPGKYRAD